MKTALELKVAQSGIALNNENIRIKSIFSGLLLSNKKDGKQIVQIFPEIAHKNPAQNFIGWMKNVIHMTNILKPESKAFEVTTNKGHSFSIVPTDIIKRMFFRNQLNDVLTLQETCSMIEQSFGYNIVEYAYHELKQKYQYMYASQFMRQALECRIKKDITTAEKVDSVTNVRNNLATNFRYQTELENLFKYTTNFLMRNRLVEITKDKISINTNFTDQVIRHMFSFEQVQEKQNHWKLIAREEASRASTMLKASRYQLPSEAPTAFVHIFDHLLEKWNIKDESRVVNITVMNQLLKGNSAKR